MYSVILRFTSCFVVTEKLFLFRSPCSSEYQTTPPQRLSVLLNTFPLVNSFFCAMRTHSFRRHNTTLLFQYPATIKSLSKSLQFYFNWHNAYCNPMLFPVITAVSDNYNPDSRHSGGFTTPIGLLWQKCDKTLLRSALPSAVRQDVVHLQPRPFHLLVFRPCYFSHNYTDCFVLTVPCCFVSLIFRLNLPACMSIGNSLHMRYSLI